MFRFTVFALITTLFPVVSFATTSSLEAVLNYWNGEHRGVLNFSPNTDPNFPLKLKKMHGRQYWDSVDPKYDEEDVQNLIQFNWPPTPSEKTFIDHKKETYGYYRFNEDSLRYELPYPVLYGWWGLNHPPIKSIPSDLGVFHPIYQHDKDGHGFFEPSFQKKIDAITESELSFGNELQLLTNTNSFERKLKLIESAKERIWITVMTFSCDPSSTLLLDALVAKKEQGLDVKLMVEGLWTKLIMNKCLKLMRKRGLEVMTLFESIKPSTFSHLTHSKFWIFDHKEAILGGQNIMDSENLGTGFNEGARDTEVYIKGPIATDLSQTFVKIWQKNRKKEDASLEQEIRYYAQIKAQERHAGKRGTEHYASVLNDPNRKNHGNCRVLSQDPGAENSTISRALVEYMQNSKEYVFLTSPKSGFKLNKAFDDYPAGPIFKEMIGAAKRNVRVDFIVNGIDSLGGDASVVTRKLANNARDNGRIFYEKLCRFLSDFIAKTYMQKKQLLTANYLASLSPNLNVWNYFRFAHQKVHYFDRRLVGIGSFNLDKHSARGNRETQIYCLDETLANQVDQMLVQDLANSVPL